MVRKGSTTTKVGREAKTGRFVPIKETKRRKSASIVQTIRRKGSAKHAASRRS